MTNRAVSWIRPIIIIVFALLFWLSLQVVSPVYAQGPSAASNVVLVKFVPNTTAAERDVVIEKMGGVLVRWLPPIRTAQVRLPQNRSRSGLAAVSVLAEKTAKIESVELDGQVTGLPITEDQPDLVQSQRTVPPSPVQINDPDFNDGQRVYAPYIMQVPLAWNYTMGDPNVIVAIVDSGVDASHPDLQGHVLPGYDFVNNDTDAYDDHGHGTHVAGIVAAAANNGIGSVGICPNCRILPVKVLNENNVGNWSGVAAGILYAVDEGARIINLSLGGSANTQVVQDAVEYAVQKDVLIVAAAGNGRTDTPFYPAASPEVMAVSATRNDDTRWSLSNYGDYIDVAAPGYAIYSTYNDLDNYYGGYIFMSGTSMAAPHVSGLAGLLLSQDLGRTQEDLKRLITTTAPDLGDPGKDIYFGYGRIDAWAALQAEAPSLASAQMAGIVWHDENSNGRRETDENRGWAKVKIDVRDVQNRVVAAATSNEQGVWSVDGLYPGRYKVEAVATGNVMLTSKSEYIVELTAGQSLDSLDFGAVSIEEMPLNHQIFMAVVVNP